MMRRPDWRERMHEYLDHCAYKPFDWSRHSCLSFACGAVTAMTGIDYWAFERRELEEMKRRGDVLRYMTRYGGSLVGATRRALSRAQAQPRRYPGEGDIIIANVDKVDTVGLCLGRRSAFVSPEGLMYYPSPEIIAAWSVA